MITFIKLHKITCLVYICNMLAYFRNIYIHDFQSATSRPIIGRWSLDPKMSPDCHPIFGRWKAADIEMKKIVLRGDRWLLFSGADPRTFVRTRGGPTLKKRQAKKKKNPHTQGERESASVFILHCISLFSHWNSFQDNSFSLIWPPPVFSLHQNTFDNVNVLVMSQFLWGEFFKHLLYEQEKNYNNKIKITFGPPLLPSKHQHKTPPLKNLGVGGVRTPAPPSGSAHEFIMWMRVVAQFEGDLVNRPTNDQNVYHPTIYIIFILLTMSICSVL